MANVIHNTGRVDPLWGEVVVIEDRFGVKITEVLGAAAPA